MPDEDLHLADLARSQAHTLAAHPRRHDAAGRTDGATKVLAVRGPHRRRLAVGWSGRVRPPASASVAYTVVRLNFNSHLAILHLPR